MEELRAGARALTVSPWTEADKGQKSGVAAARLQKTVCGYFLLQVTLLTCCALLYSTEMNCTELYCEIRVLAVSYAHMFGLKKAQLP